MYGAGGDRSWDAWPSLRAWIMDSGDSDVQKKTLSLMLYKIKDTILSVTCACVDWE